jgi:hypothetical protein
LLAREVSESLEKGVFSENVGFNERLFGDSEDIFNEEVRRVLRCLSIRNRIDNDREIDDFDLVTGLLALITSDVSYGFFSSNMWMSTSHRSSGTLVIVAQRPKSKVRSCADPLFGGVALAATALSRIPRFSNFSS